MYFSVILLFAVGAGFGSVATAHFGERAIWISCALLIAGFVTMFIKER